MNVILTRIQDTLSEKHLKVTEMFKECGLKGSTYYSWIDRDSYPSSEYIRPIANFLTVLSGDPSGDPIIKKPLRAWLDPEGESGKCPRCTWMLV